MERDVVVDVGLVALLVFGMSSVAGDHYIAASLNAEGRLGTLERIISDLCRQEANIKQETNIDGCLTLLIGKNPESDAFIVPGSPVPVN